MGEEALRRQTLSASGVCQFPGWEAPGAVIREAPASEYALRCGKAQKPEGETTLPLAPLGPLT